jgi:hypothetical protein
MFVSAPASYSAPLYVDMTKTVTSTDETGAEEITTEDLPKMFIGKVPIMLRSTYCSLDKHTDAELTRYERCCCCAAVLGWAAAAAHASSLLHAHAPCAHNCAFLPHAAWASARSTRAATS